MKLRNKIILYFSTTIISLLAVSVWVVYLFFANYRQNEFDQRLEDKILTTTNFLVETQHINHQLLNIADEADVKGLDKEEVLIYDHDKHLIYSSIHDTKILFSEEVLGKLNTKTPLIETESGEEEIVGRYVEKNGTAFYGLAKGYDRYGRNKLSFLVEILIATFFALSAAILIISLLLSRRLSNALSKMADEIGAMDADFGDAALSIPNTKDEIELLAVKFNQLLTNLSQAFKFQSHFIHHISHELKTPIAVLVSNFERLEKLEDLAELKRSVQQQKEGIKELANIINALLELSKYETKQAGNFTDSIRVDELLFDVIEELKLMDETTAFNFTIAEAIENENQLTIKGNLRLLKTAFINLLKNARQYSHNNKPEIIISPTPNGIAIQFINDGDIIKAGEQTYLFTHFFRGENGRNIKGFGLGLVLANRIIELHKGSLTYHVQEDGLNAFTVEI